MNERIEIARSDHPDSYENSGTVVWIEDGKVYMSGFGHCSCYDTWESVDRNSQTGYEIDFFVKCAKENLDLDISVPTEDEDTLECYRQVVEWDENGRKLI